MANQDQLFTIPANRSRGRYRRTFDESLKAMRSLGRLEPIDAAVVGLCRGLADELDAATADRDESRYTRGTLAARYQSALVLLLNRPEGAGDGDDLAGLLAAVRHQRTGE